MEASEDIKMLLTSELFSPKTDSGELQGPTHATSMGCCLPLKDFCLIENGLSQGRSAQSNCSVLAHRPLLSGVSNCRKAKSLEDRNALFTAKLTAFQKASVAEKRREWNVSHEQMGKIPKERLPRITIKANSKFDCLFRGRSVTDANVKPYQRYVYDHILDYQKQSDKVESAGPKYKRDLVKALGQVNFTVAMSHWKCGNKESAAVKNAKSLFNLLAMSNERITPEMLREHFLLTTPSGVALYEAFDFLYESCNQKKSLGFEDFLRYGEKLRERIFAYDRFASLNEKKKLMTIAERVLLGNLPTNTSEVRRLLMEALENQEVGHMTGKFRPMRMYELLFLAELDKKLNRKDYAHPTKPADKAADVVSNRNTPISFKNGVMKKKALYDNESVSTFSPSPQCAKQEV